MRPIHDKWPIVSLHEVVGLNGLFSDGDWILSQNMDDEGSIRLLQLADVGAGTFLNKSSKFINEHKEQELKCTSVMAGDILISRMGDPIARACIVPDLGQKAIAAVDLSIVRVDPRIADARYIVILCNSWIVRNQAERLGRGTTRKRISRTHLEEVKIPLPPLPIQKQIASILEKGSTVREKRRHANQLTEQFLQSAFLEMFGDPGASKTRWPAKRLADLVMPDDKINYGVVQPGDDYPGGVPIVRVGDIKEMTVDQSTIKRIDPKIEAAYKRSRLVGDEVLLACVGSIGAVALADSSMNGFNTVRAVARIRCGLDLNRLYLAHFLSTSFTQAFFTRETRTVSQPTLNIRQIEETKILLPPLPEQEKFAVLVEKVESLREKQKESEKELENLFNSLMQRAFKGELIA